MQIKIKKLNPDAVIPKYATELSAGFDLVATQDTIILPTGSAKVLVGFAVELPRGYEMQVRPRSGVSAKTKLRVSNAPGTVDADYRGEIAVLVDNLNAATYTGMPAVQTIEGQYQRHDMEFPIGTYMVRKGDRIAQGVITNYEQVEFIEVDELSETERGTGGFGSSGTRS